MQIIGASFDTPEENRQFAENNRFPFPLLSDTDRKIALQYGACDSPKDRSARRAAFLIDENGRIQQAHPKVDARTYPQEQLAAL